VDHEARSGAEDHRSPAQRRADALGEVCRQWLDRSDRPVVGGERPHLTVTLSLEDLRDLSGSAELDHAGPVPIDVPGAWPATPRSCGRSWPGPRSRSISDG
jgi:hypothetical protein